MTRTIQSSERTGKGLRLALNGALVVIICFFGAPFLWVAGAAFDGAPLDNVPWPSQPTLDNFRALFDDENAGVALKNSLIVAMSSMIAGTLLASLAGFGLSRVRFRRKNVLVCGVILLYAIPLAVTMVAVHDLATRLNLINTNRGLIIAQTAIMLPFLTWLMKGFYDGVPRYLDESAWLDGSTTLRGWAAILTPVAMPGVLITGGLAFVLAWGEVLLPIILINDRDLTTISRQFFATAEGSRGAMTAALGVLYVVPVLAVFLVLRRLILRNIHPAPEEF